MSILPTLRFFNASSIGRTFAAGMSMLNGSASSHGSVDAAIGRTLAPLVSESRRVLELSLGAGSGLVGPLVKESRATLSTLDVSSGWPSQADEPRSDLVVAIDLINAAPWSATEAIFAHGNETLIAGTHATLAISSPIKIGGLFRSEADEQVRAPRRATAD